MKTNSVRGMPGIRVKENGKFIAFKSVEGKRSTKEFLTKEEAWKWKSTKHSFDFLVNGKNPFPSLARGEEANVKGMLGQYYTEGMRGLTEYTKHKKHLRLKKFTDGLLQVKLSEIDARFISQHLDNLKLIIPEDSKRTNFDKELKDLASVFNWYHRKVKPFPNPITSDHFKEGIVKRVRKSKKDLSLDLVKDMLFHLEEPFKSLATVQFLLGLRIGEAAALNTHTVNFKTLKIDISETIVWMKGKPSHVIGTKTNRENEKDLTPMVSEILKRMDHQRPKGCQFYFHKNGQPLRHGLILKRFNEALKAAGLGNHSGTHLLRHSLATYTRKEMGLDAAQAALGHSSSRQTEKYARLDVNEKVTGVVLKIEDFLREVQPRDNQARVSGL